MNAPERLDPSGVRRVICVSPNSAIDKIVAVDRLLPGEIHRPDVLSVLPGGKPINVARAATLLGVPAGVVAVLAGHAGDWIEEALLTRRIAVRRVSVAGESRTCLSILDRSTGALTELYEPGVTVDGAAWTELEAAVESEAEAAAPSVVVLSGSLPPGAPADGYERLVNVAAAGAETAREASVAAVDVGGPHLIAALRARPWLVKVNAAEAQATTGVAAGDEEGAVRAATALRSAGASVAIVTRGTDSATLACDSGCWRVGPARERGAFAVGSGDAFLAAFVARVVEKDEAPEAARRAFAVAVAHALVPGQGEFRLEDAARIEPTIELVRLVPGE